MKKNFTRLTAVMLLVCILLSFVVPATYAENSAEEIVYDFQLYKNAAFIADCTTLEKNQDSTQITANFQAHRYYDGASATAGTHTVASWFYDNYPSDVNWGVETSNGANAGPKDYYFRAASDQGLRLLTGDSSYVSVRIHIPAAGTYEVSLKTGSSASTADIYIFPATTEYTSGTLTEKDSIAEALIDSANLLKDNAGLTAESDIALGEKTFADAGDYIVVFKAEGNFSNGVVVRTMTLTPSGDTAETTEATTAATTEATTEATTGATTEATTEAATVPGGVENELLYDFELYNNAALIADSPAGSVAGATTNAGRFETNSGLLYNWLIDNYGTKTNWGLESIQGSYTGSTTNQMKNFNFYGADDLGMGMYLTTSVGSWAAIRLNVTVTGTYTLQVTGGNTAYPLKNMDLYLFPAEGAFTSSSLLQDPTAYLTEENKVGTIATTADNMSDLVGSYTFTTAGDYIAVFYVASPLAYKHAYISALELIAGEQGDDTQDPTEPSAPTLPEGPYEFSGTEFNIALYNDSTYAALFTNPETGLIENKTYTKTCSHCGRKMNQCLAEMYQNGQINWVIEGASEDVNLDQLTFRPAENHGMRAKEAAVGGWIAFRLQVGVAGTYNVNIESLYGYAYAADTYLFPAEGASMNAEQITAAMTESNYLGIGRIAADVLSCEVGAYTFPTAGEYILVMKQKEATRLYLSKISLTEPEVAQPKPVQDEVIYDFDLVAKNEIVQGKFFTENIHYPDGTKGKASVVFNQMYTDGIINWKYEGKSDNLQTSGTDFRANCFRFKMKPDVREVAGGQWLAFRLDNPGTATYDIRAITSQAGNLLADVYMLPAKDAFALSTEDLEAAMTAENLVRSDFYFKELGENYIGEYTFGNEDQYIIIFHLKKGARGFLSQLKFTVDGKLSDPPIETKKTYNGTVYDLDLADEFDGIYYEESKYFMPDVIDDMNARWANGSMNWKFLFASEGLASTIPATYGRPETTMRFYRVSGMRVYSKKNSWVALKIKSPGSGDFTVSLNHAKEVNSCELAMYILPADTDLDKLWQATDPENRVGRVKLFHEDGSTELKDGFTSFVGYWNFEAGKEYIIVLEAYENSDYAENGYMNLSQIIMERGIIDYETAEEEKKVVPVTVAENVLPVADAGMYGAVAEVYGHDYYYLPLEGGGMLVYDLDTGELIDKVAINSSRPYYACVDPDGRVYVTGKSRYLTIYDPYTQEVEHSPKITDTPGLEGIQDIFSMAIDENGTVWLGGFYGAYLASYDRETKAFTSYGQPFGYQNRIAGMICRDGYLYGTVHNTDMAAIFKMEIATGTIVAQQDIFDKMGTATYVHSLNFLGDDYLIAGGNHLGAPIVLDPETFEFVDLGLFGPLTYDVTEEIDGKQYMVLEGYGLYEYDIATKTVSKVPGFGTSGIGFRTASQNSFGKAFVTLDGDDCLITYSTGAGGAPRLFNLTTQEYESWDTLVVHGTGGAEIRGFTNGPEGSNQLYMGGWNTDNCAIYNTELGKIELYYKTGGQTDVQRWYEGKLYAGNYSSTTLNEIDLTEATDSLPARNEYIQRWQLNHEETGQKRIHAMTGGDGYVFAGTTPDSDLLGGSVVVYDTRTGRWKYERNVIYNQTVSGLAYSDQILCGLTCIAGGSGAVPDPTASSVLFVYDYENMKLDAVLDPKDHISGLSGNIPFIASVEPDPVVEGRFWAIVSETLFCFTYDKESKTFDVREILSFSKTYYDTSGGGASGHSFPILFDTETNTLYATFGANGGFQGITLEDMRAPMDQLKVVKNERLMDEKPSYYLLGEDGNIYFGSTKKDTNLAMLPLNVTDEDWAIAGAVDQMILDIGEEITVESESAIRSARSAFENLSWRYKALIQKLETLQEAESDILERKIDTYETVEMTADHYPEMQLLVDEYNGLNERQQRYVKNYPLLKEKYDAASDLNDQRIAAAMQKRIDALKDKLPVTLEDEPEVVAIRADYKKLTGKQSLLVDTAVLEEAEAQIKVLRAEFVIYTESLIQAIPEEITLEAEPAITAAREAADKLYTNERKEVSYSKLTSAEGKLRTLQKAKAAAEEVDALISEIGIVTLGDKERIAEAREAYDALNGTALTFVTKGRKLETAETILKILQTWGIPVIAVVDLAAIALIFRKKLFKSKKKEEINE